MIFDTKFIDTDKQPCFFGEPVNVARYDKPKYPQFEKLTDQQSGFFWQPEEIDISKDVKDFRSLSAHEQHIFTSNLKRQILLDSVQGRAPSLAFLPICSNPELETWIQTWAFFETIHSRSYSYLIKNVYSNPSEVFDGMLDIPEIVECAEDVSKYYDELITWNAIKADKFITRMNTYQHKKALWLCLNAVNALEGVRFYVSFACSWAFAEVKKMEGNAKIIKFIARDENVHLAGTQQIIKILPKEDSDFAKIQKECEPDVIDIFNKVMIQEKIWAKFLFQYGSMIGLNYDISCDYIDFLGLRRMAAIGIGSMPKVNPLPWTQKWISGSDVQVAPQETEITSYIVGGMNRDVDKDTFKGFKL